MGSLLRSIEKIWYQWSLPLLHARQSLSSKITSGLRFCLPSSFALRPSNSRLLICTASMLRTLDAQPDQTVRLIILDYVLSDGECLPVLARLRDEEGKNAHPALHPEARIIGWSANDQSVTTFRAARVDGFISKHRDPKTLIQDVLQMLQRLNTTDWVEFR
jgi:CheY-like chemotaxis protein